VIDKFAENSCELWNTVISYIMPEFV